MPSTVVKQLTSTTSGAAQLSHLLQKQGIPVSSNSHNAIIAAIYNSICVTRWRVFRKTRMATTRTYCLYSRNTSVSLDCRNTKNLEKKTLKKEANLTHVTECLFYACFSIALKQALCFIFERQLDKNCVLGIYFCRHNYIQSNLC